MKFLKKKITIIFLIVLILGSISVLVLSQIGLFKYYDIDLSALNDMELKSDIEMGGNSTITSKYTKEGLVLNCELKSGYEWPYGQLVINLAERSSEPDGPAFYYSKGVDFSSYEEIFVKMKYKGAEPERVRIYLRNYNPIYTNLDKDSNSLKINEVEFAPNKHPEGLYIPFSSFQVTSWWSSARAIPLEYSGTEFSNISMIEIATAGVVSTGPVEIIIEKISFRNQIISKYKLLFGMLVIWLLTGLGVLGFHLKKSYEEIIMRKKKERQLYQVMETLKIEKNELSQKAIRDPLTNVRNRAGVKDHLIESENDFRIHNIPFSIIFADIDHFKKINDTHGHQIGDEVIIDFSKVLNDNVREDDVLVRWGGEEFVVLCKNTTLTQAYIAATKLCKLIRKYNFPKDLKVTSSFGVAEMKKTDNIKTLIDRADEALYSSKTNGRNQVSISE